MPRRRSRSGKKSSADVRNSRRSAKSDKEDAVTSGNSDAAEHSSGKDGTDSAEEEARPSHSVESQDKTTDAVDTKNPVIQSKEHDLSNPSSATINVGFIASPDGSRCNSSASNRAKVDDNPDTTNSDVSRPSRPNSLVSRGKLVFERGDTDKWIRNVSESQEDVYNSEHDTRSKDSVKVNEKTKIVASENKHNSIPSTEEQFDKFDGWVGNRQKEDKPDAEKPSLKMTSPVDIPPEGTDDATRSSSIPNEWVSIGTRRQRRLRRSKDRGDDKQNENSEQSDDGNDRDVSTEDDESVQSRHTKEEQNQSRPSSSRPTSGYKLKRDLSSNLQPEKPPSATSKEKTADKEYDTKVSVFEIKRKFSCHADESNELFKLRGSSLPVEADLNADEVSQRKDRVPSSAPPGPCTTELYVATVTGKDSSSASFLSAVESSSGTFVDDKSVKYKPKSLHAGWVTDADKTHVAEEVNSEFVCSDSNKMSVKQLKERLISSCSDISDKAIEGKRSDDGKSLVKNVNNDDSLDKLSKGYEKEEIGVSVKERLETYRCQATKAYHNIQSYYAEQEMPSVTSIKELKSSFNKMVQPSVTPIGPVNKSKVKNINDDLAQMQSFSMKCKSCGKQVFFMERIMAEKAMWHKKCFRCKECQKQLTVENYKSQDGELYCQSHYMNILKPKPTDDTVSASSVIEEIKIPPLNLKPLFEKNQSSSQASSPPSSPPSVEKSPKFLKRLAKFEGTYRGESEEDEDYEVSSSDDTQSTSPEKKCKSEEMETYLQEECNQKTAMKGSDAIKMNILPALMLMDSTTLDDTSPTNQDRRCAFEAGTADDLISHVRKESLQCNKNNIFVNGASKKVRPKSLELKSPRNSRPAAIDLELRDLSNISVREMREQLISSCVNGKSRFNHESVGDRTLQKNKSDGCIERLPQNFENKNCNISLRERLDTYKCQTKKEYINNQPCENNQLSVASIKELQTTFNKMSHSNGKSANSGSKSTNKNSKKDFKKNQSFLSICKSCREEVFFMEGIKAENAIWHKRCFKCRVCQKQLALNSYKSQNGELYCQFHYAESLKPKAKTSDDSITTVKEMDKLELNSKTETEKDSNVTPDICTSNNSPVIPKSPNLMTMLAMYDKKCNTQVEKVHKKCKEEETDVNSNLNSLNKLNDLPKNSDEECKSMNEINVLHGSKNSSSRISSKTSVSDFNIQQILQKSLNNYDYISTTNNLISNECEIPRDATPPSMMVR